MNKAFTILIIMLTLLSSPLSVNADEGVNLPYQVSANLGQDQIDGVTGMIAVRRDNLEDYEIQFTLTNISNDKITMSIFPLNPVPSSYGGIQYIKESYQGPNHLTSELKFSELVEMVNEVELEPKETKIVSGTVKLSEIDDFDSKGEILGGIAFKEKSAIVKESKDFVNIDNEFQTVIGVSLVFTDEEYSLEESVELKTSYVEKLQSYYQINLPMTFNNFNTLYGVSLEYTVKDSKGDVVFEGFKDNYNVAPHSHNDLSLVWSSDTFDYNETYRLSGVIRYKDQEYPFNEDVDIEYEPPVVETNSNGMNTIPKIIEKSSNVVYIVLFLFIFTFTLFLLFLFKRRKDKYEEDPKKELDIEK